MSGRTKYVIYANESKEEGFNIMHDPDIMG